MSIKKITVGSMKANCYIITEEKEKVAAVIDPGAEPEKIIDLVKKTGCRLLYIILTHAHVDHICALDELKNAFGSLVVIHKADAPALNDAEMNLCNYFGGKSPVSEPEILVADHTELLFGSKKLQIIHTPGHTEGSMCIQYGNTVFCGDTIFRLSIGRTDFLGSNPMFLYDSIKYNLYTLDDNTRLCPGHGINTTVLYEKENNPFCRPLKR